MRWRRGAAAVLATILLLGGCSAPPPGTPPPAPPPPARVSAPTSPTVLGIDDPAKLAVATSAALFRSAPVAVLADVGDPGAQEAAVAAAARAGAPLLLTSPGDPAGVAAELARLGTRTVLTVGPDAARWAAAPGRPAAVADAAALPAGTVPPPPRPQVLVLTDGAPTRAAALATATASGARTATVPGADPRNAPAPGTRSVLALGTAFGPPAVFAARLAVAAAGKQLPGGGQVMFPGRRMVALYGTPGIPALGVLGEQDIPASVARVKQLAAQYQPLVGETVVPTFELIATVASATPGAGGDYSSELSPAAVRPWVDAARAAGVYVVLDLQPGRADFLTQARRYADLLAEPNVGLALDPEWRLGPNEVQGAQIGSVGVDEVNRVVTWLADLTREQALPQKLLMLHQFRLTMIKDRARLDTSRDQLSVVIHSDGFGTPAEKTATWNALHVAAPPNVRWGWKNFIDEDKPTFTPAQTVPIPPTPPVFISYQ